MKLTAANTAGSLASGVFYQGKSPSGLATHPSVINNGIWLISCSSEKHRHVKHMMEKQEGFVSVREDQWVQLGTVAHLPFSGVKNISSFTITGGLFGE